MAVLTEQPKIAQRPNPFTLKLLSKRYEGLEEQQLISVVLDTNLASLCAIHPCSTNTLLSAGHSSTVRLGHLSGEFPGTVWRVLNLRTISVTPALSLSPSLSQPAQPLATGAWLCLSPGRLDWAVECGTSAAHVCLPVCRGELCVSLLPACLLHARHYQPATHPTLIYGRPSAAGQGGVGWGGVGGHSRPARPLPALTPCTNTAT